MIEIKSVEFKNILSFGDYMTKIDVDDLGPCFITGHVIKDDDTDDEESFDTNKDSNGAGKSTFVNIIMWALFGRTMHKAKPGDNIVNYFTGKNCYVKLTFKNGDELIRTRKYQGHSDLLYIKDGQDASLGTTNMQQDDLNRELNLDWDIFSGCTFFSQYGRGWLEMGDTKRREALEREFRLDKIAVYADVAKEKVKDLEKEQEVEKSKAENFKKNIEIYISRIKKQKELSKSFEVNQQSKIEKLKSRINSAQSSIDSIKLIDIDPIEKAWGELKKYEEAESKLKAGKRKCKELLHEVDYDIKNQKSIIKKWEDQPDTCPKCEQKIPHEHVTDKLAEPRKKLESLTERKSKINAKLKTVEEKLDKVIDIIDSRTPDMTVKEAKRLNKQATDSIDTYKKSIGNYEDDIKTIELEENQHELGIKDLKSDINDQKDKIIELAKKIKSKDKLINHYNYINKAYRDRRKIKKFILQNYVPYFNKRIAYYMDKLGLDLRIEFTFALGIKSQSWGYEFFSGGERKRADLALMLALFDTHNFMYNRQSNILVFDEVDGRLDSRGAECFADIVKTDMASKVDTIFVISQRPDMKDVFPSSIKIKREDRFSRIDEITT